MTPKNQWLSLFTPVILGFNTLLLSITLGMGAYICQLFDARLTNVEDSDRKQNETLFGNLKDIEWMKRGYAQEDMDLVKEEVKRSRENNRVDERPIR